MDDDDGLGARFWLKVFGVLIVGAIAAMILFLFIDLAWYAWGAVGTLLFVFIVLGGFAYVHDRREQRRYEDIPEG